MLLSFQSLHLTTIPKGKAMSDDQLRWGIRIIGLVLVGIALLMMSLLQIVLICVGVGAFFVSNKIQIKQT